MQSLAIYPGTFDPITLGHFDLIERGASIFDRVVLGIAQSTPKDTLFSLEERMALCRTAVGKLANVEVEAFDGLLIDYVHSRGARILIRGVRAFSDFEYEFQMALINRKLAPDIETLFMMPNETYSYLSSSRIKEVAALGGEVHRFVPPNVHQALLQKYPRKKN
ncbi:MAG: pantetheine-phosphate adenylyltransferase [Verrucomicrobia bacterium]|nr:pantetheine-phosphate adenylyltransferase [Verrucomicrobiota bacterium]